jgi:predicted DsbA family dithiol-disulfide isomerase
MQHPVFIFLVNGKQPVEITGAQPYTVFESAINQIIGLGKVS